VSAEHERASGTGLPATYRKQPACGNCAHVIGHSEDGWYCNVRGDRAEYPSYFDYDDKDPEYVRLFDAATAWEIAHNVEQSSVCDEFRAACAKEGEEHG
jgi:hypothetical protein